MTQSHDDTVTGDDSVLLPAVPTRLANVSSALLARRVRRTVCDISHSATLFLRCTRGCVYDNGIADASERADPSMLGLIDQIHTRLATGSLLTGSRARMVCLLQ